MNILNLSTYDYGGAGSAVLRINEVLISLNHNSKVVVLNKKSHNKNVIQLTDRNFNLLLKKIYRKIHHELQKLFVFKFVKKYNFFNYSEKSRYVNPKLILKKLDYKPEIIIIHYTSHFINFKTIYELQKLTKARIIFNMLDTAFLTGGCHYSWKCIGYHNECSNCSALKIKKNISIKNLTFKKNYLNKMHSIHLVASSSWAINQAKMSSLFRNSPKSLIYYPLDETLFKPRNKVQIRNSLNIPQNNNVIFMGAHQVNDPRKGINLAIKSLNLLFNNLSEIERNKITVITAGNKDLDSEISFNSIHFGIVNSEKLAKLYSSCNIFLCPSVEDNGPMMINEAVLSGCSIVSFNVGVSQDLVSNINGYLAENFNDYDLFLGLRSLLNSNLEVLQKASREIGIKYLTKKVISKSWQKVLN